MLLYNIGVTFIPDIGDINGKKLIAYCGGTEAVFKEKKQNLLKINGIGTKLVNSIINNRDVLKRAEEEIKFIEKHKITPLFFTKKEYPERLKHCIDSPMMLYYKGNGNLNSEHVIGIVGTRKPSEYGKEVCEQFIADLATYKCLVASGLAYGIDSLAHKSALKNNLETVGVLAHGLDMVYPSVNKPLARNMIENGGLITEFPSKTKMDPAFFPRRNRVVAGMSDAVLVIESGIKGGSLITADIANSYNRDVFAIPGRINDPNSEGCNFFIKTNRAALVQNAKDIATMLGWEQQDVKQKKAQKKIFIELSTEEKKLFDLLNTTEEAGIDWLSLNSGISMTKVANALLNMEFNGLVKSMPGKRYKLA